MRAVEIIDRAAIGQPSPTIVFAELGRKPFHERIGLLVKHQRRIEPQYQQTNNSHPVHQMVISHLGLSVSTLFRIFFVVLYGLVHIEKGVFKIREIFLEFRFKRYSLLPGVAAVSLLIFLLANPIKIILFIVQLEYTLLKYHFTLNRPKFPSELNVLCIIDPHVIILPGDIPIVDSSLLELICLSITRDSESMGEIIHLFFIRVTSAAILLILGCVERILV
jgi:hypothetical protein